MKVLRIAGLFAVLLVAAPSRAEDAHGCAVPAYLLATESTLPKVADAIKTRKRLDILVAGSGSSALPGSDGASMSYPSRLEAALREALAGVTVNVRTELRPKKTAAEAAEGFGQMMDKLPPDQKPDLVIWQLGTNTVLRDGNIPETANVLQAGISRIRKSGADVLLIDPQFAPRVNAKPAVSEMVGLIAYVAKQTHVPLFRRYVAMRNWHEDQAIAFDRFITADGLHMNDWGYSCLARLLADNITATVARSRAVAGVRPFQ